MAGSSGVATFYNCPPVVAHRGTGAGASGGTVAGFVDSLKDGAQILEMDVRFTANGTPVVYHDATIAADTNGHGAVASFKTWRALSKFHIDGSKEPIPTLSQVLKATHSKTKHFVIEFKTQLEVVAAAHPDLRTALISSVKLSAATVRESGTAYLPNQGIVDVQYVDELHAAGVTSIYPWTVNTLMGWTAMDRAGVDGMLTDKTGTYLSDYQNVSPVRLRL
jgi:glycerophosphoryl diester phosphodiesterase